MNINAPSLFQNNSAHRDVLSASIPGSDSSKRGLLEELKNRGRAAVGGKVWLDAQMLYEKALQVAHALETNDAATATADPSSSAATAAAAEGQVTDNEIAILHSNLSLAQHKMGKLKEAKSSAEAATVKDPTYVKGWWRLAQALSSLKEYSNALEAMEKAKLLDPNNKALTKECDKLREEAAKVPSPDDHDDHDDDVIMKDDEKKGPKTEPAPPRSELYKSQPVDLSSKKSVRSSSSNSNHANNGHVTSNTNNNKDNDDEEEEEDKHLFTKSEPVRGYKIVNGKKTSYFHNELTDEARQLIGDIAPKKLDPSAVPTIKMQKSDSSGNQDANNNNSNNNNGTTTTTSAWNQAGTWEERDVTVWAKQTLTEALLTTTYVFPDSSPAPGALARVSAVPNLDGHASFATVRGRKKYIYEFCMTDMEWVLDLPNEPEAVKGRWSFPDVDGTCELGDGYEMTNFQITSIHTYMYVL